MHFKVIVMVSALVGTPLFGNTLPPEVATARDAQEWDIVRDALGPLAAEDAAAEQVVFWHGVALFETGDPAGAKPFLARALKQREERDTARFLARCAAATNDRALLDDLAKRFPRDASIAFLTGKTHFKNGFTFKSITNLNRAVLLDDLNAEYWAWLAFLRKDGFDEDGALEAAQRARSLAPVGWEVHALIGECLYDLAQYSDAADAFGKAQEAAPAQADRLAFRRGQALHRAERHREAMEVFHGVLTADFNHRQVRAWLGMAAFGAGDYRVAWYAFREARDLDANVDVIYYTGRTAYALGHYEEAEALFREVFEALGDQGSPPASWHHYLGRALWGQDRRDEALVELEAACKQQPGNVLYARWLFRAYEALDDPHACVAVCRRLGTDGGEDEVALDTLNYIRNKWPEARGVNRKGQRVPPQMFEIVRAAAEIYRTTGRFQESAMFYMATGQTVGRAARVRIGWCILLAGNAKLAAHTFRTSLQHTLSDGKDPGRFGLAFAEMAQGNHDKAVETFNEITRESMKADCETGLFWIALERQHAEARDRLDPYTALGLCANRTYRGGQEILYIIPGSPLDNVRPALRHDDVLLRVGSWWLDDDEGIAAMRDAEVPEGVVRARVRRGEREFAVDLDYGTVLAALPAATTEGANQ